MAEIAWIIFLNQFKKQNFKEFKKGVYKFKQDGLKYKPWKQTSNEGNNAQKSKQKDEGVLWLKYEVNAMNNRVTLSCITLNS